MIQDATVIGSGQMATVAALVLAERGARVRMWCRSAERAAELAAARCNARYLPDVEIPPGVSFTADPREAWAQAELIVSAVPCQHLRELWTRFKAAGLRSGTGGAAPIVSVTKGIEVETLLRPTQVIEHILGAVPLAVLSGPNIAGELSRRLPATAVAASADAGLAARVQQAFATPWFRIYTNTDVVGVELAGAIKNVIALAAGIIDGLRAGDNAKSALLTRGLVEMTRLGVALGARRETFWGLAGLGDLVTTCVSPAGRNRRAGEAIGRGTTASAVQASTPSVIEGIPTTRSVMALARRHGVEMPITAAVYAVLFEGKDVLAALTELMGRDLRGEE